MKKSLKLTTDEKQRQLTIESWLFRGRVIHEMCKIEELMNIYIANSFCDNEKLSSVFVEVIMHRFSLQLKKNIFIDLLKIRARKSSENMAQVKIIEKSLKQVIDLRNQIAHERLDYRYSKLNVKKIENIEMTFSKYRTDGNHLKHSFKDKDILEITEVFDKLQKIITFLTKNDTASSSQK